MSGYNFGNDAEMHTRGGGNYGAENHDDQWYGRHSTLPLDDLDDRVQMKKNQTPQKLPAIK